MMGKRLDLPVEAIPMEHLDRVDDPRVQLAATLLQQAAVRDLVRERVLERILEIRIEPGLVEKLGALQAVEPAPERLVGQFGDRLEQRERHVLADYGSDLQESFIFLGQPVDARCQHHVDRGWDLDRLDRSRQLIASALSRQRLRLHQRANRLLQEERVPALDQKLLEGWEAGIVAEERVQQFSGTLGRKRVQPQLAVVRLPTPAVLVLGTVVHEQQEARRTQALDQTIEQRLRLAVYPVEVLDDQQE